VRPPAGAFAVRKGTVYRRCGRCGKTVQDAKARRCPHCGGERVTWAFRVDLAPVGAKRHPRSASGFASKREALEAVARLQTERIDGRYVEPSKITLGRYLDDWLAGGPARGWKGNTARDYRVSVRHIKGRLAEVRLQALDLTQVEALYGYLLTEGMPSRRKDDETRKPLSRKSVANVHITLRAALNDAVEQGVLRRNPAIGAFTYSRTKDRVEMLTWSGEEMKRFMNFTTQNRDFALYRTALMTGLRRGELLGLRWRDLDLDAKVDGAPQPRLHVREQWTKDGDAGLRILGLKTGTKAWRTIDLDEETAAILRQHREAQSFERHSWGPEYGRACPRCAVKARGRCTTCGMHVADLDLVFGRPDGLPQDPDVITRRFERRAGECPEVRRIRFHDQRHTHATLLLENGESLKYVAERLGDREDTVLETYGHVTARMRAGAVSRLAALIDDQAPTTKRSAPPSAGARPAGRTGRG
jgi:integrase